MKISVRLLRSVKSNGGLDFSNTREAYRSKTFGELLRHYLVYKVFAYKLVVESSQRLMEVSHRVFGKRFVSWLMKRSFYSQFVGGEDVDSLSSVIGRLHRSGVSPILDYAVEEDVSDQQPVVMEVRKRDATPSLLVAEDPQFNPSLSSGKTTKLASARTYFYQDDERCQQNMQHFLSCIRMASQVAESTNCDAFAAVKLTGLGRVEFLLRLSEVITGAKRIFLELSAGEAGRNLRVAHITADSLHRGLHRLGLSVGETESQHIFEELDRDQVRRLSFIEWFHRFQPGTKLHTAFKMETGSKVRSLVAMLSESELVQMSDVIGRAEMLAQVAQENGVRLMIDAEQSYFQPAICHIAVNVLMPKYNLTTPTIYNTVQCYLKEAETMLSLDLAFAEETGFMYGVKLVRGAYMEQERALAQEKGYADPIWPCKTDTDVCYNRLLDVLLRYSQQKLAHIMVASHNEHTITFATEKLKEYGIARDDGSVVFGQLLGMCDHVTFPLGQAGYLAYKYVPYGPVEDVLPYLLRRAHENKGMLGGALRERQLVKKELCRRLLIWRK